jgi:L-iditol 2-dehydrogenase
LSTTGGERDKFPIMKALLLTNYKQLELADMPLPEIGDDDVLVQVKACGICGSDIHGYDGSSGRRIPPLVMGHEASGVIAAVGKNVKRWKEDTAVTFDSMVSCGRCHFCRRGQMNLCDNRQIIGVSIPEWKRHGAFAEYVAVPQQIIYGLPKGLAFPHAALIEAVSVAVHASNISGLKLGDTAVVVGSGMIGILCVQALRAAGCGTIIAIDLEDHKLDLAKTLGADFAFNPKKTDVKQEVLALTQGRGADLVMEVVGATPTVKTAVDCVRKGGTVTLVGNITANIEFPLQSIVTREVRVLGSCGSNGEYPECMDLMARGAIKVDPIISSVSPLEQGAQWFERLYGGEQGLMKVVLQP